MRRIVALLAITLCHACTCGDDDGPPADPWTVVLPEVPGGNIVSGAVIGEHVYAVGGREGRAMILRWDGTEWAEMPGAGRALLWWIWGSRVDSVYAVGESGTILHFDGTRWSRMPTARAQVTFWGVWGAADDDVWAVGGSATSPALTGAIYHYDGTRWLPIPAPEGVNANLFKIWGSGSRDVWIVGERGTILHWSGGAWAKVDSPTDATLTGLWGTSTSNVWVAGGLNNGFVLHYDGAGWSMWADLLPRALTGVYMGSDRVLHVSGFAGLLGHFEGDRFVESPAPTDKCLHALWGSDDLGLFTGSANLTFGEESTPTVLLHHPGTFPSSEVGIAPGPDGGREDAGLPDAMAIDGGAGAGDECSAAAPCASGLDCWTFAYLAPPEDRCTHDCQRALDCVAEFGPGACCRTPGPQTTRTVCYQDALGLCP